MLKTLSTLQHIIGSKVFRFECEHDSSLVEAREALCEFVKYVGNLEDVAKANEKAAAEAQAAEKAAEEVKPEDPPKEEEHV